MGGRLLPANARNLLNLEERLLDDGHGFLLSLLPRHLFINHNGNIILNPEHYPRVERGVGNDQQPRCFDIDEQIDQGTYPVFAFFSGPDNQNHIGDRLHLTVLTQREVPGAFKTRGGVSLLTMHDRLDELNEVPPLSWHEPSEGWRGSKDWVCQTTALIKYFLLVWAYDAGYESSQLPLPKYDSLRQAFEMLEQTRYFENARARDERPIVTSALGVSQYVGNSQAQELLLNATTGPYDTDATTVHYDHNITPTDADVNGVEAYFYDRTPEADPLVLKDNSHERRDPALPTPASSRTGTHCGSPFGNSFSGIPQDEVHASSETETRGTQSTSAPSASAGLTQATPPSAVPLLDPASSQSSDGLQEHQDGSQTEEADSLTLLREKVGSDLLSALPHLSSMMFKRLSGPDQTRILPLRLLIGTFTKSVPQAHLRGQDAWAWFRVHDKEGRAAPRMHLSVFNPHTDESIEVSVRQVLPHLNLGAAFAGIHVGGMTLREHQTKSIVKYYFILAADAGLHGFTQHRMPINESFVENMTAICKRMQDPKARTIAAQRHREGRTHSDFDADDEAPHTQIEARAPSARYLRNRPARPAAVTPDSDMCSDSTNAVRKLPPRRLAIGSIGATGSNRFLTFDAEPLSSDGESGDEIPGPIPEPMRTLLRERDLAAGAVKDIRQYITALNDLRRAAESRVRKLTHQLGHGRDEVVKRELEVAEGRARGYKSQLAVKEQALKGFKLRKADLDSQGREVHKKWAKQWKLGAS
ncbi:hypothetical protein BU26DRAFT_565537 [Trematosphaeria pertusa]|uniref:Uncharacterized protein n=1 Tax=Trematosphaeria pertusa TaxID=390896 RepID=A0A6A6IC22_9PLEO|nr:uncharacterized protein BU26DRAFT_565537 [Trematosphaeria pertusa]KAF2248124.1 hypothetical protein BU26DRAFT_565537 [Trematosphaeria pertusa]